MATTSGRSGARKGTQAASVAPEGGKVSASPSEDAERSGIVSVEARAGRAEGRIIDEAELTQEQIAELRQKLDERRASLVTAIEGRRAEEQGSGREVGDEMDDASVEGAAGMTSKLLERDVRLLAEVTRAIDKMRDGSYGTCEETGEPIGYARLRLQPWARYGVAWQEELERRARTRGGI